MKVSVNAILTTLVGGNPVTTDGSEKAVEKLFEENKRLNANLPVLVDKTKTREELIEANIKLKSERIYEMLPALKEMEEELAVARQSLSRIMEKRGMNKAYFRTCEMIIADAEELVVSPKSKTKTVNMKFEDEIVM